MKISFHWLKEFLEFPWNPQELAEVLTSAGLEVESLEEYHSVPGGLQGVVVGDIRETSKHPNADKLTLCQVDTGGGKILNIVCGAPNVAKGQKVLVATVGTTLYPRSGEPLLIKKSKIRGEESEGMICASDELGLNDDHSGIVVLNADAQSGTPAAVALEMQSDWILEIGLTPNRGDAASHFGVIRDIAAVMRIPLPLPVLAESGKIKDSKPFTIELPQPEFCPRYTGIRIQGIKVGESPAWLKNRLISLGSRPINNVVDVTNYVMQQFGHPLHAFDASKIRGGKVIVQTLEKDQEFISLDGSVRKIHAGKVLMICDAERPLAIAGIMGGKESAVTESTTDIFLESAYFSPEIIRAAAKRLGMHTDASFRFERGANPRFTLHAAKSAAIMIAELCGGTVYAAVDEGKTEFDPAKISYNISKGNEMMGFPFSLEEITGILRALEIEVAESGNQVLECLVPPYRSDVTRPQDLMEEILRISGYDKVEFPAKTSFAIRPAERDDPLAIREKYFSYLAANGFMEIVTNSLLPANLAGEDAVKILNNLSEDLAVMRQSMLTSGLESIAYNINRKNSDLRFFEFGKVYSETGNGFRESEQIALYMTGNQAPENWRGKEKADFFTLKGEVEKTLKWFSVQGEFSDLEADEELQYGLRYHRGEKTIAKLGQAGETLVKKFEIEIPVYYAVFQWEALYSPVKKQKVTYRPAPRYPAVTRDISMFVPGGTGFREIGKLTRGVNPKLIRDVNVTDVYSGKGIPEGMQSYLISLTLLDENATLTDEAVDRVMGKVFAALEKNLSVIIRK